VINPGHVLTWLDGEWPLTLFRRIVKIMPRFLLVGALLLVVIPLLLRAVVSMRYHGDIYTADSVPPRPVAIVFGARVYSNGRLSAMLSDRVATGVALYKAGKVKALLMTGDNSTLDYDEPTAMKRTAVQMGVPESAVVVDYAGRRTYDSCYRAQSIFQVSSAILVTQNFHLDRALMLCNSLGVSAVGVGADYQRPNGYAANSIMYSELRELPAVFVGVIDLVVKPTPILGEPLPIFPEDDPQE
jgi:SanA protein